MRHHAAWHILFDDKVTSSAPCGLCAINPQAQYAADGAAAGGCSVWLEKIKKTLKPRFNCATVGMVDFIMGAANKSSAAQPSTNVPIQCPACPSKPMPQFFWKFRGMGDHWVRSHSSLTMPPDLMEMLVITEKERDGVADFKTNGQVARSKKAKRKAVAAAESAADQEARQLVLARANAASLASPAEQLRAASDAEQSAGTDPE